MKEPLKELLTGVIDYAGLFPPAKLSMRDAVQEYHAILSGSEEWLVNRFICPVEMLGSLVESASQMDWSEEIPISVTSGASGDWSTWKHQSEKDISAIQALLGENQDLGELEALEVRAPAELKALPGAIKTLESVDQLDVFVEVPWTENQREWLGLLAESDWLMAKARTGGVEPSAFPSSRALASFIRECVSLDLPFKCTAGLHHPVRTFRSETNCKHHGFLNVLFATTLAMENELSTQEIESILEEEDPRVFKLDDSSFHFRDWQLSEEALTSTRDLFIGFGSCSIDEPLGDLTALGFG